MKRQLSGLALIAVLSSMAAPASAGVTRYAEGRYLWRQVVYKTSTGQVLLEQAYPTQTKYLTARGYYGGGDTTSGRLLAKERAAAKAQLCMDAFYRYGAPTTKYAATCLISDITIDPSASGFTYFQHILTHMLCSNASSIRAAHNYWGPLYVTASASHFADNTGTERDFEVHMGSVSTTCY